MIDSVIELTSERDTMNAELDSLTENKVTLEEIKNGVSRVK